MIPSDEELAEKLIKENEEFKTLSDEHDELKKKIKDLDNNRLLTADQNTEISQLKKIKLKGKERMHKILAEYRQKVT